MKNSKEVIDRIKKDIKKHQKKSDAASKLYFVSKIRGERIDANILFNKEAGIVKALESVLRFGLKS